jgi:hypothetical protein
MQPASKFENASKYRRFALQANVPRLIGMVISLTYLRFGFWPVRFTSGSCFLEVDSSGRLKIALPLGRSFKSFPIGKRILEIEYETVDDRFGEGTKGQLAYHMFGEGLLGDQGGEMPWLIWDGNDLAFAGGSYTVGPEGIRN